MTPEILIPLSFELFGLKIAGPAILVIPALGTIIYFPISCLLWICREAKVREGKGWFISPIFRRQRPESFTMPFPAQSNDKKSLLGHQLDEILKQEQELQKEREEIQRSIEDLPRQQQERQLKREKIMRERAQTTTAFHGFGEPNRKLRSVTKRQSRMTRPEVRSAWNQLLLLCAILLFIFLLLWKSLH